MPNSQINEYAVRLRDERTGDVRIDIKPSMVMVQDSRNSFREAYADGGTYFADAEVVTRCGDADVWVVLSDEDIARIDQEAWEGLDRAMAPVIAAGLAQLADQATGTTRPNSSGGAR